MQSASESTATLKVMPGAGFTGIGLPGAELRNDLDQPDNVTVELRKLLRGNPKLLMHRCSNGLNRVAAEEALLDIESRHESRATLPDVPIPSNLRRVLLIEDRIENRLLRKPGRKLTPPGGFNESKLFRTDRTIQSDLLHGRSCRLPCIRRRASR